MFSVNPLKHVWVFFAFSCEKTGSDWTQNLSGRYPQLTNAEAGCKP